MRYALLSTLFLGFLCACVGDTSDLRMKLDDAVQRRASITEPILEWGAPSGKHALNDGRIVYTWKIPWTWNSVDPLCTIVITASADNIVEKYDYHSC